MSPITTHVLDTSRGCPAAGLPITLKKQNSDGSFSKIAGGITNNDGRISGLLAQGTLENAVYQMHFDTKTYFDNIGVDGFYPEAVVTFHIQKTDEHYHIYNQKMLYCICYSLSHILHKFLFNILNCHCDKCWSISW